MGAGPECGIQVVDLPDVAPTLRQPPGDETERRVMAGAIVGVLIAFSHNNPMPEEAILEALSVLESKMA